MAEPLPPLDFDSEPSPVLDKMDALIARHRGAGPDPNVPVLTNLAPAKDESHIPVLTEVAPVVGDDLMFTPEEIRAEDAFARAAPVPAPAPRPAMAPATVPQQSVAQPAALAPTPLLRPAAAPVVPPVAAQPVRTPPPVSTPVAAASRPVPPDLADMIEVPPLASKPKPVSPTVTAAAPAAFDFPDLKLPDLNPATSRPPVAAPPPPPPISGPLMPELALNFDFAEPAETATPPVAKPAAVAPALSPAVAVPPPAPPVAAAEPVFSFDDGELELTLEAPKPDAADMEAVIEEVCTNLHDAMEKMVRAELAKQIAGFHVEALKRTLSVLHPQLRKLVANELEAVVKRRWG